MTDCLSESVHQPEDGGTTRTWQTATTRGGGWISWRSGLMLPRSWHTTISGEHLPCDVELDFEADGDEPRCVAISFGGPSLTPRLVDAVPIGACIDAAITAAARRGSADGSVISITLAGGSADLSDVLVELRGRGGIDYARVARVYLAGGKAPTQAVCDEMIVTYSTAQRYVAECRRRGLLPPA
jgi:hypothetical protein